MSMQRESLCEKPHLISLSHVAVEDSSHTLDGRMLQLMGPPHVVIDAPGQQGKKCKGRILEL